MQHFLAEQLGKRPIGPLRRQQIEAAKGGNITMLIWLGKQMLGQADKAEVREDVEVTAAPPKPLALTPEDEEFLRRKSDALLNIR